jgi:WD40 repeat protein
MNPPVINEKEVNFLILRYLHTVLGRRVADVVEKEFSKNDKLPVRFDWKGKSNMLSYNEMMQMYPHISPEHLKFLLEKLLGVYNEVTPFPSRAWTLLGHDGFRIPEFNEPHLTTMKSMLKKFDDSVAKPPPLETFVNLVQKVSPFRKLIAKRSNVKVNIANVIRAVQTGVRLPPAYSPPIQLYSNFQHFITIQGHQQPLYCIVFDHSGNRIITGGDDYLVKVWSTHTGLLLHTLRGHQSDITDLAIDERNEILATSSNDMDVRLWDLKTFHPIAVLQGHKKFVTAVQFCPYPEERILLSTSASGEIRLWWTDKFPAPPVSLESGGQVWCAAFSPGGTRFITGGDGCAKIWSIKPPRLIQVLRGHGPLPVKTAAWCHYGSKILTGSDDGTARLWDWSKSESQWISIATLPYYARLPSQMQATIEEKNVHCTMVCWSLHDKYAITAFSNSKVKVWDAKTGNLLQNLDLHTKPVYILDIHPTDERILLSGGYDGMIVLWDIQTGVAIKTFKDGDHKLADGHFSPHGQTFVISDKDGFFSLYGTGDGELVRKAPTAQFFITDYYPLRHDEAGNVLDETFQVPPHEIDRQHMLLTNQFFEPYTNQPTDVSYIDTAGLDLYQYEQTRKRRLAFYQEEMRIFGHSTRFLDDHINSTTRTSNRNNRRTTTNRTSNTQPRTRSTTGRPGRSAYVDSDEDNLNDEDFVFADDEDSADEDALVPIAEDAIAAPAVIDDVLFSSGVMTRSERRRFEKERKLQQRQLTRHENLQGPGHNVVTPIEYHTEIQTDTLPENTISRQMRHKLRRHLTCHRTPSDAYPLWLTSTFPSSLSSGAYTPQLGDRVVFFKDTGYKIYMNEFVEFSQSVQVPDWLPAVVYCRIGSIKYHVKPFIHCTITLVTEQPQPEILKLCGSDENGRTNHSSAFSYYRGGSSTSRLVLSNDTEDQYQQDQLEKKARLAHEPVRFTIHYHATEHPDCLVLASRFEACMKIDWKVSDRFRMFYPSKEEQKRNSESVCGSWYFGRIGRILDESINVNVPWESVIVKWDAENYEEHVSPWEIQKIDLVGDQLLPIEIKVETINPDICRHIINVIDEEIVTSVEARHYLFAINLKEEASYNSVVPYPIDISTIVKRLRQNYYRTIDHLKFDIRHISENSRLYYSNKPAMLREGEITSNRLLSIVDRFCTLEDRQRLPLVVIISPEPNENIEKPVFSEDEEMEAPKKPTREKKETEDVDYAESEFELEESESVASAPSSPERENIRTTTTKKTTPPPPPKEKKQPVRKKKKIDHEEDDGEEEWQEDGNEEDDEDDHPFTVPTNGSPILTRSRSTFRRPLPDEFDKIVADAVDEAERSMGFKRPRRGSIKQVKYDQDFIANDDDYIEPENVSKVTSTYPTRTRSSARLKQQSLQKQQHDWGKGYSLRSTTSTTNTNTTTSSFRNQSPSPAPSSTRITRQNSNNYINGNTNRNTQDTNSNTTTNRPRTRSQTKLSQNNISNDVYDFHPIDDEEEYEEKRLTSVSTRSSRQNRRKKRKLDEEYIYDEEDEYVDDDYIDNDDDDF